MSTRRFGAVVALVALFAARDLCAQPAPAADSTAGAPAETKVRFQRGVKLYTEEDYRAALVEFKRAFELSGNRAILFNVGQTQFQLRDYAGALQSFEEYLRGSGTQLSAARRQQVEKDIEDLRGRIAKVTIETNVPGVDVTLDDAPLGVAPLSSAVVVSAGIRKFGATKEGYSPVVRSIEVAGGDVTTLRLELVAVPAPHTPSLQPPPPHPPSGATATTPRASESRSISPVVLAAYGVGAAGLATGAVFGALALGTKADLDARCENRICPTSERSNGNALTTQATISSIGFGVGLVGLGVGTYFLLSGGTSPTTTASAPRVTPWFTGTSAGLSGAF